jgi:hypothetical protein
MDELRRGLALRFDLLRGNSNQEKDKLATLLHLVCIIRHESLPNGLEIMKQELEDILTGNLELVADRLFAFLFLVSYSFHLLY